MKKETTAIHIPFQTVAVVLATIAAVKLFEVVAPILLTLVIAGMIAVSLEPVLVWLDRKGLGRNFSITLITLTLMVLVGGGLAIVGPKIYSQALEVYNHLPQFKRELLARLGEGSHFRPLLENGLKRETLLPKAMNLKDILGAGNAVLGGFAEVILVFVLAIYLLIDGPRIVEWVSAFFSPSTQQKIEQTNTDVSKIISAYVAGQVITSVLSFLFVLTALNLIGVPNTLLLATLSGILDVLPVLGFVIAVVPAMFFALEVSVTASLATLGIYVLYHAIENYLIVPLVYGRRLRVSGFVVFFGLVVAGLVAGIKGAIAILPFLAAYPVIEKIWLRQIVRKEAIAVHKPD